MLTTANEIGGVDASSEKRRALALQSRFWRTGPINHERMVTCGLFCEKSENENENEVIEHGIDRDCDIPLKTTDNTNTSEDRAILQQHVPVGTRRNADEIADRLGSRGKAQVRKRRTMGEKIIILSLRTLFTLLKSPLRLGILMFAVFHFILRPVAINTP